MTACHDGRRPASRRPDPRPRDRADALAELLALPLASRRGSASGCGVVSASTRAPGLAGGDTSCECPYRRSAEFMSVFDGWRGLHEYAMVAGLARRGRAPDPRAPPGGLRGVGTGAEVGRLPIPRDWTAGRDRPPPCRLPRTRAQISTSRPASADLLNVATDRSRRAWSRHFRAPASLRRVTHAARATVSPGGNQNARTSPVRATNACRGND
jgi:hypothetical protein